VPIVRPMNLLSYHGVRSRTIFWWNSSSEFIVFLYQLFLPEKLCELITWRQKIARVVSSPNSSLVRESLAILTGSDWCLLNSCYLWNFAFCFDEQLVLEQVSVETWAHRTISRSNHCLPKLSTPFENQQDETNDLPRRSMASCWLGLTWTLPRLWSFFALDDDS
jgi:hypothetical protein